LHSIAGFFAIVIDGLTAIKPSISANMNTFDVGHVKYAVIQPSFGENERTSQGKIVIKILVERPVVRIVEKNSPIKPGRF
jgi:hypothetical protein